MKRMENLFYPMIRDQSKDPYTLEENAKFNLTYEDEWNSIIETNDLGFRGEIEEGGTLFLGDSFTASIRLDYNKTFLALLESEEELEKVNNMAVGGWSTVEERKALEKYWEEFKPDEVILVLYLQNDVWENYIREEQSQTLYFRHPYKSWLAPISYLPGGRTLLNSFIGSSELIQKELFKRDLLVQKDQFSVFNKDYSDQMERGWEITKNEILKIKRFVESRDSDFKIISMPSPWQVSEVWREEEKLLDYFGARWKKTNLENLDFEKPERKLKEFVEQNAIECRSLYEEKDNLDESFYFNSVDHWNKKGHKFVLKYLKDRIF